MEPASTAVAAKEATCSSLLIGQWHRDEFRAAVGLLHARTELVAVRTVRGAERLLANWQTDHHPERPQLIVLAQSRPGQFDSLCVARLRRMAPLARVLGLLGSWCEGELRTGRPWPAADRLLWYQWPPRFVRELEWLIEGRCPTWGVAETATPDERLLWQADQVPRKGSGTVVVGAASRQAAEALCDACRAAGYEAVWLRTPLGKPGAQAAGPVFAAAAVLRATASSAIWDGAQCDASEAEQLRQFSAALAGVPVVALLDFPRTDGAGRAASAGAATILGKPPLVEDLLACLEQLTHGGRQQATAVGIRRGEAVS